MDSWKAWSRKAESNSVEKQSRKAESHSIQVTEKQSSTAVKSADTCARNVRNVANRCVFSMIRASWCSKSRLVEAAGAEVAAEKRYEKWHAAVARSTFVRQNVQNTSCSEPFWKFRSRKMARRCGAKHISTSKCTKQHHNLGAIFEVAIRKNGTPLWREAHFQVKMCKTPHARTTFWSSDVQKIAN